mgnify:FL=1|jgi:hypothetical protein
MRLIKKTLKGLKILGKKYHESRKKQADQHLALYLKNHGDVERYLDVNKTNALHYTR